MCLRECLASFANIPEFLSKRDTYSGRLFARDMAMMVRTPWAAKGGRLDCLNGRLRLEVLGAFRPYWPLPLGSPDGAAGAAIRDTRHATD